MDTIDSSGPSGPEKGGNVTKREAAIIETYTGICMLTGDNRKYAYEYAEKLLGFSILTHEFAIYADKLKKLSKPDFIKICRDLDD